MGSLKSDIVFIGQKMPPKKSNTTKIAATKKIIQNTDGQEAWIIQKSEHQIVHDFKIVKYRQKIIEKSKGIGRGGPKRSCRFSATTPDILLARATCARLRIQLILVDYWRKRNSNGAEFSLGLAFDRCPSKENKDGPNPAQFYRSMQTLQRT